MKAFISKTAPIVFYLLMVFVNFLAVTLPLAGRDTAEISDSYPNLFAPAGFTFSIWGVIYTLLGMYVIYQFLAKERTLVDRVNKYFIPNALLNAIWIFTWHYNVIWLSVIVMLGILLTLIKIAEILRLEVKTRQDWWLVTLPFSVYFGWITVATIANITIFLVSAGWNGFGLAESIWTVIVLLVGVLIGVLRMWRDRTVPYGLVLIWAYGGILAKHLSETGFAGKYPSIISTVVFSLVVFLAVITLIAFKQKPIISNK